MFKSVLSVLPVWANSTC